MVPTTRKPPTPLKTWRNNNVVITSKRHFDVITSKWRRFDVITTLILRILSAGTPPSLHPTLPHPTKMTFNEHILSNTLLPINMLCVNKSDKSYPKGFFTMVHTFFQRHARCPLRHSRGPVMGKGVLWDFIMMLAWHPPQSGWIIWFLSDRYTIQNQDCHHTNMYSDGGT